MANQSLVGKTLGKYRIVEPLGRGGMAEVFRAYQENLDRYVAVKVMHSFLADEQGFLVRFQREAKAMASLNHNNIVAVYDFDVQDGMYYIVMEYVSGGTLKYALETLAESGEQLPLAQSIQLTLEIADALAYAHARSMVHRDIKPGNIMINEGGHAVLTDFGIAKILSGPTVTATGAMIGTPAYMSPEQGLGQPGDERSDLYALGVLFYQMITGKLPYDADTPLAVILKHVNEPIPQPTMMNPEIPDSVQLVAMKAMAKDPNERYQKAREMIIDLTQAASAGKIELGAGVALSMIRDEPTPPPIDATRVAVAPATVMSPTVGATPVVDSTRISTGEAISATEIAQAPPIPTTTPAPYPVPVSQEKKRSPWAIILIVLVLLIIGGAAGGFFLFGGGDDPTPTPVVAVATTPDVTPSPEPSETLPPGPTADNVSTAVALIAGTLTAQPTQTLLPTTTNQPTQTPTPDLTAAFLDTCSKDVDLISSFTYENENSHSAPTSSQFPMNWVLRNSGECPLPAGLSWEYEDGEEFGQSGPVILEEELPAGEEVTLTANLRSPNAAGRFTSSWQLMDENGDVIGAPQDFEIVVFVPQTPTPRPTATSAASPTAVQAFGYNINIGGCIYLDGNWQCDLSIVPFGGVGPYTATISDASPPSTYEGTGPFTHLIVGRRCNPWVNTITVRDDGTGQTFTEPRFVDPDVYFNPCVLP